MTRNYRLIGATAISISTLAILTVAATAQDMSVFERPSKAFYDVTVSHMPQAPTLHALEAAVFLAWLAIVWLGLSLAH